AVAVGRPDAAAGGADLAAAAQPLGPLVLAAMRLEDHVRAFADQQVAAQLHVEAAFAQLVDLAAQVDRIDDDADADDVRRVRMHDARRNQMQDELARRQDQGVACVVATAEAHHEVGLAGEEVDDFALAFVTPEDAYDTGCGHGNVQRKKGASITPGRPGSPARVLPRATMPPVAHKEEPEGPDHDPA